MNKPVFDILQHDDDSTIDWHDCRLVVEINQHYFYYVVLNGENSIVALKYYQFSARNHTEMIGSAKEIMKEDHVLSEKMKDYAVIYNLPENCLVPETYFNMDLNKDILQLLHGDMNKGMVFSEKIPNSDTYNIFRIPLELHDFFEARFPACKYWHYYSLWLKCIQWPGDENNEKASVVFYPNVIIVAVIVGGSLQVIQAMEYQTAEDVIYHMLNIYSRFGLKQEETVLEISGMVVRNSAMYEELVKYFLLVKTDSLPEGLQVSEDFKSFPEHFFSPLLKLALCVS